VPVSTVEAYQGLDQLDNWSAPSVEPMLKAIESGKAAGAGEHLFNSFERWVYSKHPLLAQIKKFCLSQGFQGTLLSGSGSNIFVLHEEAALSRLQDLARERFPEVESTLTKTCQS
jgi:4-diphosphocytidyl-2C-methyl-D-erythritol kinase